MLLDALIGEPRWLWQRVPHPVVVMGKAIGWLEARMNRAPGARLKGAAMLAGLVAVTGVIGAVLSSGALGGVIEVLLAAILLAHRSLLDHVRAVSRGLGRSVDEGRAAVSMIVGRDTAGLDDSSVSRAAIESAAENFSDGVVAPAFWFLIGGLPGIMIYKLVNTADSMVGYRNDRYLEFGWASARLDDVMNWIPARLSGAMICLVGGGRAAMEVTRRDAGLHRSPNAGWPEAALAASLGIALSGPRTYEGQRTEDPYVNPDGRIALNAADIDAACAMLWRAWGVLLVIGLAAMAAGLR
ncbi:cobalamin biosynthesis protein [Rhodobacteraceae bacterium NNCM2]|nr:cobalamin biosynthesis protein [Coraliihabitans acroporae]